MQLIALGLQIVLQWVLTEQQLMSWGWRIAFGIGALGALVLVFSANRGTLRDTFYKVVADLQGGVVAGQTHASHGLLHELDNLFTTSSAHLHELGAALLAYAEDEAGGLMNPRYIRVRPDMTAAEALGYFRRQAQERSGRDHCYRCSCPGHLPNAFPAKQHS